MPAAACPSRQRGTALLTVLFMVILLGLAASLAGQALRAYVQREREEELLWRGQQYMRAIGSYQKFNQGGQQFPTSFEDLLRDPRSPGVIRHLRRLYDDPMTGQPWEPIKDPANRIIGVRSTSELTPFRQDGFPKELEKLAGKDSYREWEFIYTPAKKPQGPIAPGAVTPPGTQPPTSPVTPPEEEE